MMKKNRKTFDALSTYACGSVAGAVCNKVNTAKSMYASSEQEQPEGRQSSQREQADAGDQGALLSRDVLTALDVLAHAPVAIYRPHQQHQPQRHHPDARMPGVAQQPMRRLRRLALLYQVGREPVDRD